MSDSNVPRTIRLLRGTLNLPADKSITHRALMFSAFVKGRVKVLGPLRAADCLSTLSAMRRLGLEISDTEEGFSIVSKGLLSGAKDSVIELDCGNSGTTTRLLSGLVAGNPHLCCQFDGDDSLRSRDMKRVLTPLSQMGAQVEYLKESGRAPFRVTGARLTGGDYALTLGSAQVASALILAALQADGRTTLSLPAPVRDHSERMLTYMGAAVHLLEGEKGKIEISPLTGPLKPCTISVPADISSAAFFLVGAALMQGSSLLFPNCGVNPGRTLVLDVLAKMGLSVERRSERLLGAEPVCDLYVESKAKLQAVRIDAAEVASGIDELPALALAMAFAEGKSVVAGVGELRAKESDRLALIVENINAMGGRAEIERDGDDESLIVYGGLSNSLKGGGIWKTERDHRMVMTGLIASLILPEPPRVEDQEFLSISYPTFKADLNKLLAP